MSSDTTARGTGMAREGRDKDEDREVQDTTLARGTDTHAWSAVDRPGTDPSDPRPQGPDTGGFADVPPGVGPGGPGQPAAGPAGPPPYGPEPGSPYGPAGEDPSGAAVP